MFEFHKDRSKTFIQQFKTTEEYIIPFIQDVKELSTQTRFLEIGCGEAGVTKAFARLGMPCTGIELHPGRVKIAQKMLSEEIESGQVSIIQRNIYDIDPQTDLNYQFDVIVLKDVIEHIPDQKKFLGVLRSFLKPDGVVFFGFPPWQMPFGGHQQACEKKILSYWLYLHLLPMPLYLFVLKLFGESKKHRDHLKEIKELGLSIERFERFLKANNYEVKRNTFFLTNPIYKYKFGFKTRKQARWVNAIPYFRNFVTTCAYYVVKKR